MPTVKLGDVEVYYEDRGEGYPVLVGKPPWRDPLPDDAAGLRIISADHRITERSHGPMTRDHSWSTLASDQLALMDHLGIERFGLVGESLGASVCLKVCEMAPDRVSAVVLLGPIGFADNRAIVDQGVALWARDFRIYRPYISSSTMAQICRNLFDGDFVFSTTREFVRTCGIPMLVFSGNDPLHPPAISAELIELAANREELRDWAGPEVENDASRRVIEFLRAAARDAREPRRENITVAPEDSQVPRSATGKLATAGLASWNLDRAEE